MACGCNKNKNSISRGPALRPGVYNRSSSGNITAPVRSQAQVRSQSTVAPSTPSENGVNGATVAKRKIQALRREALLKAKGK